MLVVWGEEFTTEHTEHTEGEKEGVDWVARWRRSLLRERTSMYPRIDLMKSERIERVRRKAGSVLRIPCDGNTSAYAMITSNARLLCFDYWDSGEGTDFRSLPVLWVLWVRYQDLLSKRWAVVDRIDPEIYQEWFDPDYFIQDPINKKLKLTKDGTDPRPATLEQCKGLERAAVWDARHVEDRFIAHIQGIPCKWVEPIQPVPDR